MEVHVILTPKQQKRMEKEDWDVFSSLLKTRRSYIIPNPEQRASEWIIFTSSLKTRSINLSWHWNKIFMSCQVSKTECQRQTIFLITLSLMVFFKFGSWRGFAWHRRLEGPTSCVSGWAHKFCLCVHWVLNKYDRLNFLWFLRFCILVW